MTTVPQHQMNPDGLRERAEVSVDPEGPKSSAALPSSNHFVPTVVGGYEDPVTVNRGWRDTLASINLIVLVVAWPAFLVVTGIAWTESSILAMALIVFVGGYVHCWLGYYRHELWHNYFPGLDNPRMFDLVSSVMFSDPQIYRVCHPAHHKYIHSSKDLEFFCANYNQDRKKRRRQFLLELVFGNMAWELDALVRLKREGKACKWKGRRALMNRLAILVPAIALAGWLKPGAGPFVLLTFALTSWLSAVVTRQNQWIEHLGLQEDGAPLAERDLLTRNLKIDGLLSWLFNFYNHNDAREHTLHHTIPRWNSRNLPGLALPPGAQFTTLGEHVRRLYTHYTSL